MRELRLVLRTPTTVLFDAPVAGVRLATPDGQVGVHPGAEAWVTALAPGLVLIRTADGLRYAGTAGGIARLDGRTLTLFTPFAALGAPDEVAASLAAARGGGAEELAARARLAELEKRITHEVHARLEGGRHHG